MRVNQRFDDLNDLVADLRGRVGRDGMLLPTDQAYSPGTVLSLDISLAEDTPLIRGTAGVIQLLPSPPGQPRRHVAVLEFLELDQESEAFVGRLVARLSAEGAELFELERYVRHGRRGVADPRFASPAARVSTVADLPRPLAGEGLGPGAAHGGRAVRRAGWLWGVAAMLTAAVAAATVIALLGITAPPIVPGADPGPLLVATVGSPPDAAAPTWDDGLAPPAASSTAEVAVPNPGAAPHPPDAVPPALTAQPPPATRVDRISWRRHGPTTIVTLDADGRLAERNVSWARIDGRPRPRIVLYLNGIGSGDLAYRTAVRGPLLEGIRVWCHDDTVPVQLHVVLDLTDPRVVTSTPIVDGRRLVVVLQPPEDGGDLPPAAEIATALPS